MDMNSYAVEMLAREQLAELRGAAARHNLIRAAAPPRRLFRVALGLALIRIGAWALNNSDHTLVSPARLDMGSPTWPPYPRRSSRPSQGGSFSSAR